MTEDELKYIVDIQIFIDELLEIVGMDKPRWRRRVSLVPNSRWCPHHHN